MSFRRHLMSTVRNAKRESLEKIRKAIEMIETPGGNIQDTRVATSRDIALGQIDDAHWLIMSDTGGTPPPKDPEIVMSWAEGDPEKVLRDARAFLLREADLVVDGRDARNMFVDTALEELSRVTAGPVNVHDQINIVAELVHMKLYQNCGSHITIAPADVIEMPLRELCGLDGQIEARGPDAGDAEAAILVCQEIENALNHQKTLANRALDDLLAEDEPESTSGLPNMRPTTFLATPSRVPQKVHHSDFG